MDELTGIERYNYDLTKDDIMGLIDDLKNNNMDKKSLMKKYDFRNIDARTNTIERYDKSMYQVLDTCCKRDSGRLIMFFWNKMVYDTQYNNLTNLDIDQIVTLSDWTLTVIINLFLNLGDGYGNRLINFLEKIHLKLSSDEKHHQLEVLAANNLRILRYDPNKDKL